MQFFILNFFFYDVSGMVMLPKISLSNQIYRAQTLSSTLNSLNLIEFLGLEEEMEKELTEEEERMKKTKKNGCFFFVLTKMAPQNILGVKICL